VGKIGGGDEAEGIFSKSRNPYGRWRNVISLKVEGGGCDWLGSLPSSYYSQSPNSEPRIR
jgi:hypothetical protein